MIGKEYGEEPKCIHSPINRLINIRNLENEPRASAFLDVRGGKSPSRVAGGVLKWDYGNGNGFFCDLASC